MNNELSILLRAMREAGDAILHLQKNGFSVERKANNDLLTQADLQANDILKKNLLGNFPQDGWLSEESVDDVSRLSCERVWVVDPIDGTIEFTRGIPEYAISVALVERGLPILSAVFNPASTQLFHAIKNGGAWLDDKRIYCDEKKVDSLLLLASRSEYSRGEWSQFEKQHQVKVIGSIAYKLALVAAGYAHATFSLEPKNEWDIAGGVLLVSEAGGVVTNQCGELFLFNQKNVRVNGIVASAHSVEKQVMAMIGKY